MVSLSLYNCREDYINQEQLTQSYNRLMKHAYYKAGRYFRDKVMREDAAMEAVNDAVDLWIREGCYDEDMARTRIESSLRQSSLTKKLEPITVYGEQYENTHGYEVKE